jgi:hypothetical protein
MVTDDVRAIPPPKTASHRGDLSRPVNAALHDGLLASSTTLYDYGCGHGLDS